MDPVTLIKDFNAWFWNPDIWCPVGYDWESLVNSGIKYPRKGDIWTYPFAFAALLMILRFSILVPYIFRPIAFKMGLRDVKPKSVSKNPQLESLFRSYRRSVPQDKLSAASNAVGWPQRRVEWWLRRRSQMNKISKFQKAVESMWEVTYYSFYVILSIFIVLPKPWVWNIELCFIDYPRHDYEDDVFWYYMIACGFYWAMIIMSLFEHKRKDSKQMLLHHLCTITLIVFSWYTNYLRFGALILLIHECVDIPLMLAKLALYAKYERVSAAFFVVFLLVWCATRIGLYPFWMIRNGVFHATDHIEMYPVYYILNGLLFLLLFIHIYWSFVIAGIVKKRLSGTQLTDTRSDSDLTSEDDDNDEEFYADERDIKKKK